MSDVVVRGEVPASVRSSMELWVGCIAGALAEEEYVRLLGAAGFEDIGISRPASTRSKMRAPCWRGPAWTPRYSRARSAAGSGRVHPRPEAGMGAARSRRGSRHVHVGVHRVRRRQPSRTGRTGP